MFTSQKHKNKNKVKVVIIGGFLCLFSGFVFSEPTLAPVNPKFTKYLQDYRLGKITTKADGYSLGYIPPPVDLSHLKGKISVSRTLLGTPPSSYDLRNLGRVTSVKDQGAYGTCWAFASYASLESCLLPTETWDFSENNMVNLHGFDWGFDEGGVHLMSTAYLTRWSGPIKETDDPYPNPGGSPPDLSVQKHVQNVQFLPPRSGPLDNDTIKQAVMDKGAVYTAFYWEESYYNSSSYAYYYNGAKYSNHAVAIVGWDDNFSKNNFSPTPSGNGAFILKNSWGTAWGNQGYFYISYYDTQLCGEENAVFYNAEPLTNYDYVYQYDPLGWVASYGYSSNTAWFANIFSSSHSEEIKAVGFYVPQVDSTYKIRIYKNVSAGQPTSGSLAASKSGTIPILGYHTIMLDSPVSLASGERFSVVVKLTTPGYDYPIPIEKPLFNYSSHATATTGQSYISSNGTSWSDITNSYSNTNVCLKAYTDRVELYFDITRPQTTTTNVPFILSLVAKDKYGNPLTTFSGTATLTNTTNSISPSTIPLVNGTWTGMATITASPNGGIDTIIATYGSAKGIATITVYLNALQGTVTFGTITSTMIEFGTGSLGTANVTVSISTSTTTPTTPPSGIRFAGVIYNIEIKDEQGNPYGTQFLPGSVTLSFHYSEHNGYVDGTKIREEDLIIYLLEDRIWTPLFTYHNGTDNLVWVYPPHFSTFTLGGTITFTPTNNDAYCYPNPWKKNDSRYGGRYIYFDQVSEGSTIRIYNIVGELIDEIRVTDCPQIWDIQSKNLASGIYIYCITGGGGGKKVGKIGIIR